MEGKKSGDEHFSGALRGLTCSRCNLLIRSSTYYECQEGCLDEYHSPGMSDNLATMMVNECDWTGSQPNLGQPL